jgi:activator of HSP90 ATPase
MMKSIEQEIIIKASTHNVYEALMDSRKHAEFTGDKASISREIGGSFSAYDGYIEGINLDLIQDEKIVQSWRGSDWPEGHYSTATFTLEKVEDGTRLTFTQTDVPDEVYNDVSQGWYDYYWEPMKEILEK